MSIVNVTVGVDTHSDTHAVAAVDHNGGLLGVEASSTMSLKPRQPVDGGGATRPGVSPRAQ